MSIGTSDQQTNESEMTRDAIRLDTVALAGAVAVVSAAVMLLLGVFGAIGIYEGAVVMMEQWHLFFEPTLVGTVAGMLEAAAFGFAAAYAFALTYNAFAG